MREQAIGSSPRRSCLSLRPQHVNPCEGAQRNQSGDRDRTIALEQALDGKPACGSSGADDTVTVQVQLGELAVGVLQSHPHRTRGPAGSAADVGDGVFESLWKHDLRARLRASVLVADRLADSIDVILDEDASLPASTSTSRSISVNTGAFILVTVEA